MALDKKLTAASCGESAGTWTHNASDAAAGLCGLLPSKQNYDTHVLPGHYEVALILPVLVVQDNNHPASSKVCHSLRDGAERPERLLCRLQLQHSLRSAQVHAVAVLALWRAAGGDSTVAAALASLGADLTPLNR